MPPRARLGHSPTHVSCPSLQPCKVQVIICLLQKKTLRLRAYVAYVKHVGNQGPSWALDSGSNSPTACGFSLHHQPILRKDCRIPVSLSKCQSATASFVRCRAQKWFQDRERLRILIYSEQQMSLALCLCFPGGKSCPWEKVEAQREAVFIWVMPKGTLWALKEPREHLWGNVSLISTRQSTEPAFQVCWICWVAGTRAAR